MKKTSITKNKKMISVWVSKELYSKMKAYKEKTGATMSHQLTAGAKKLYKYEKSGGKK